MVVIDHDPVSMVERLTAWAPSHVDKWLGRDER